MRRSSGLMQATSRENDWHHSMGFVKKRHGVSLPTGATMPPLQAASSGLPPNSVLGVDYYPPTLTGVEHNGAFEVATRSPALLRLSRMGIWARISVSTAITCGQSRCRRGRVIRAQSTFQRAQSIPRPHPPIADLSSSAIHEPVLTPQRSVRSDRDRDENSRSQTTSR